MEDLGERLKGKRIRPYQQNPEHAKIFSIVRMSIRIGITLRFARKRIVVWNDRYAHVP
ncbi:hypothetical protein [Pararhizobium mangrovi]|uniref:hypothetical protein n=1 Tax=Pararhizobium mangrovi TaxID=2590452 RepID=UPI0015E841E2|nr:hypothetical protein [Pararhizobium mangrovi]